jgi:hypothetical protein
MSPQRHLVFEKRIAGSAVFGTLIRITKVFHGDRIEERNMSENTCYKCVVPANTSNKLEVSLIAVATKGARFR